MFSTVCVSEQLEAEPFKMLPGAATTKPFVPPLRIAQRAPSLSRMMLPFGVRSVLIGIGVAVSFGSLLVVLWNLCRLNGPALPHTSAKSFASKCSVLPQAHSTRNTIPGSTNSPNVSRGIVSERKRNKNLVASS
jgi:hypothetical protein